MKNLIDIKQTSELLNMKVPTLYRWVHERKIPFVKMGNKLRFKETEILDFIEQNSFSIQ